MDVESKANALAEYMAVQLRVKGENLAEVSARAGRRLPKRLRPAVDTIVKAQTLQQHPRLKHVIDERAIKRAEKKLRAFLDRQDPRAARRGEILDVVARIAFVVLVVVLAVFFFLLWRGHLT